MKALGVNIEVPKERVEKCLNEIGIAFLFAPLLHGAMKYATPVRKELGIRTVFNILGPLTNPAGAKRQLLGVYRTKLTEVMANVLFDLGTERAMVVHGVGGMDEISTIGETKITEIRNGTISTYNFIPASVGIPLTSLMELAGGDLDTNKTIILSILKGKKSPRRDISVLNAGAALFIADVADSIADGVKRAQDAIDSGLAQKKLDELIDYTN